MLSCLFLWGFDILVLIKLDLHFKCMCGLLPHGFFLCIFSQASNGLHLEYDYIVSAEGDESSWTFRACFFLLKLEFRMLDSFFYRHDVASYSLVFANALFLISFQAY